jgi:cytochrome c oxidase subunit 2
MIMQVLNGKNMMPAWKDLLNDTDIGAVVTFARNSWGNTVKDVVQPSDVKAMR